MLSLLDITTSTSSSYNKPSTISKPSTALSHNPVPLFDLDYTEKSIDSLRISDSVSVESLFDIEKESKLEILMSIFPGIREVTEKEAQEYQEFLEAYFD